MAAHRPQEIATAAKAAILARIEDATFDQLLALRHAIDVFGDPIERVEVAQSALAILDVRLHQIARLSRPPMTLLALGKFGGDELRRAALHDLLVEARHQLVIELAIAQMITRLQHRRADGHVGFCLANAFGDGTGGMTDLESHIPEAIEDR